MDNITAILYKTIPDIWRFRKLSSVFKIVAWLVVCYSLALLSGYLVVVLFEVTPTILLVTNAGFALFLFFTFGALFHDKLSPAIIMIFVLIINVWPAEISSRFLYDSRAGIIALKSVGYIAGILLVFGVLCHILYRSTPELWNIVHNVQEDLRKKNCVGRKQTQ